VCDATVAVDVATGSADGAGRVGNLHTDWADDVLGFLLAIWGYTGDDIVRCIMLIRLMRVYAYC
jgi:hypothetical protein